MNEGDMGEGAVAAWKGTEEQLVEGLSAVALDAAKQAGDIETTLAEREAINKQLDALVSLAEGINRDAAKEKAAAPPTPITATAVTTSTAAPTTTAAAKHLKGKKEETRKPAPESSSALAVEKPNDLVGDLLDIFLKATSSDKKSID